MPESDPRRQRYEGWVQSHAAELYRFAYRLCGRSDVAEDLVQDTFSQAWKSMESLRDRERARSWLFQILRHRWAHVVRDENRRIKPVRSEAALESAPAPAGMGSDPAQSVAEKDALQAALNALEEELRVPFLMVFVQGLTCQETADELEIPLGTVLSRMHRARQQLRGQLGLWYGTRGSGEGKQATMRPGDDGPNRHG